MINDELINPCHICDGECEVCSYWPIIMLMQQYKSDDNEGV